MGRLKNVRRKILTSWEGRKSTSYVSFVLAFIHYLIRTLNLVKLECVQIQSKPQRPDVLQPHLPIPSSGLIFTF